MAFDVEITDPARDDIDAAVMFIAQKSQAAARKWKTELQALILSLQGMPGRFAVIAEAGELGLPYRSAPHHSHRVIFRIDEGIDEGRVRSLWCASITERDGLLRMRT